MARHNIELGVSLSHCFDMHGGRDREDGTDIAGALVGASSDYVKANLAGLVLISDGIHNAPQKSVDQAVKEASVPIYTVGVVEEIPDLRTCVSVDGGLSDNPRPALYEAVLAASKVLPDRRDGSPPGSPTF